MRGSFLLRRIVALALPLAALVPATASLAADVGPGPGRDEFGGGLFYLKPGSPLDGGFGVELRYTRTLPWSVARRAAGKPHPWALRFGIDTTSLDRSAAGDEQPGTIRLTRLSVGAVRTLGSPGPLWDFSLAALLDYYFPVAGDTTVAGAPIGITSRLDASSGAGGRLRLEAGRRFGKHWRCFAGLGVVGASLDGSQRFVIDGVEGAASSLKLDLNGPEAYLGLSRRF